MNPLKIAVAGAGSIGCFVGGLLAHQGHEVRFLARPCIISAIEGVGGLRLTDYAGMEIELPAPNMTASADALAFADIVLVTVKSSATVEMAGLIAQHAKADAIVVSLQNGVGNVATLREGLPNHTVLAGMVPFNVVSMGAGAYHRATSGDIEVGIGPLPNLSDENLVWKSVSNIENVQWGKLLINLGNALNALSGMTLYAQLQDRAWRRLIADQMSEALGVLKSHGIKPAKTTAAPPAIIPHILRLPTPIFRRVAAQMLTMDPSARSSMWDDLTQRRVTEVDAMQGVIIEMAGQSSVPVPLNTKVRQLIKQAEAKNEGPPGLSVKQIRNA